MCVRMYAHMHTRIGAHTHACMHECMNAFVAHGAWGRYTKVLGGAWGRYTKVLHGQAGAAVVAQAAEISSTDAPPYIRQVALVANKWIAVGHRHHPSSIIHHPSSIMHHASSIVHHPSSIIHDPACIIHHPSSVIDYPSSIIHH